MLDFGAGRHVEEQLAGTDIAGCPFVGDLRGAGLHLADFPALAILGDRYCGIRRLKDRRTDRPVLAGTPVRVATPALREVSTLGSLDI